MSLANWSRIENLLGKVYLIPLLFINKLRERGPFSVAEAVLRRIEARLGKLRRRFEAYWVLREADFTARLIHESGIEIKLPRVSFLTVLLPSAFGEDRTLFTSVGFCKSATAEILLRRTIYRLYADGQISSEKSIVDIGCWCGDNTLAWAKLLCENATLYAVDPLSSNLAFAQAAAKANQIDNVTWAQAVCSEKPGEPLGFAGPIEHATFHVSKQPDAAQVVSKTLDEIVGRANRSTIGLLHVDVEGSEERVLRGAAGIIEESNPVITFERHLCDDNSPLIFDFLMARGYQIFMLNEILTNCRPDCSNFVAFPAGFAVPHELTQQTNDVQRNWYVTGVLGPELLEFAPSNNLGPSAIAVNSGTDK